MQNPSMVPNEVTLRDWFAVHALALLSWEGSGGLFAHPADDIAKRAYRMADALLKESAKKK